MKKTEKMWERNLLSKMQTVIRNCNSNDDIKDTNTKDCSQLLSKISEAIYNEDMDSNTIKSNIEKKDLEDSCFMIHNEINNMSHNSSQKYMNCFSPDIIHDVLEIAPFNESNQSKESDFNCESYLHGYRQLSQKLIINTNHNPYGSKLKELHTGKSKQHANQSFKIMESRNNSIKSKFIRSILAPSREICSQAYSQEKNFDSKSKSKSRESPPKMRKRITKTNKPKQKLPEVIIKKQVAGGFK